MKRDKIIDSCSLIYFLKKNKFYFEDTYILPFQLSEINPVLLKRYFLLGGRILNFDFKKKGDLNFFCLNPDKYYIITHDKELKKQLKRKSYKIFVRKI